MFRTFVKAVCFAAALFSGAAWADMGRVSKDPQVEIAPAASPAVLVKEKK